MESDGRLIEVALTREQALKVDWFAAQNSWSPEDIVKIAIDHVPRGERPLLANEYKRGWSREDLYDLPSLMKWQKPWLYEQQPPA